MILLSAIYHGKAFIIFAATATINGLVASLIMLVQACRIRYSPIMTLIHYRDVVWKVLNAHFTLSDCLKLIVVALWKEFVFYLLLILWFSRQNDFFKEPIRFVLGFWENILRLRLLLLLLILLLLAGLPYVAFVPTAQKVEVLWSHLLIRQSLWQKHWRVLKEVQVPLVHTIDIVLQL